MNNWTKAFWVLFIIAGALVITGSFIRIMFLDILLGIIVIAIGIQKLGEDLYGEELDREKGEIKEGVKYLTNWIDSNQNLTKNIKTRHEHRFHHIDRKRIEMDGIMKKGYRELAKKILETENKLNEISRALVAEIKERDKKHKKDIESIRIRLETIKKRMKR